VGFWDTIFINPMINGLIVLEQLFGNFGIAIIVFTILVRLATLPLTLRQLHAGRKMQAITPQIQELQKKYKDPKRRQEETMKLYREAGVNPIGCLGPMIIQFPIWIALYRVLTLTVGGTPERTTELSQRLYSWSYIQDAVPLPTRFLGMDLGRQDAVWILFALTFVTTWLQTRMSLSSNTGQPANPQTQQMNSMMLWMMPMMFAYFTFSVPSGLSMYWVVTNIIGIVMNWFVYGWNKRPLRELLQSPNAGQQPTGGRRGRAALVNGGSLQAGKRAPDGKPTTENAARPGQTVRGGRDTSMRTIKRPSGGRGAAEKRTPNGKGGGKRKDSR
jgi:YidC/Oxa1 family membrane protein insertase